MANIVRFGIPDFNDSDITVDGNCRNQPYFSRVHTL